LDELTRQAGQLIAGGRESSGALPNSWESGNSVGASPGSGFSAASGGGELYTIDVSSQSGNRLNAGLTSESVGQVTTESGGSSALSIASAVFGSGLGIIPLVSGLLGIFGGGSQAPPALERYVMPDRLYLTGADTGAGIGNADYDQFGMPRLYGGMSSAMTTPASGAGLSMSGTGPGGGASPQINVTVQAMDSQSFLDHSSEIAQAVRQAMLSLSSVNDVVSDL
jgi:hypothetical protein